MSPDTHVVRTRPGSFGDIVEHLRAHGARVHDLAGGAWLRQKFTSKLQILFSLLRVGEVRRACRWRAGDRVLVVGWVAVPVLMLVKLRLLPQPGRMLVMACFVHGRALTVVRNLLFRLLKFEGLGFVAFSAGEARGLSEGAGLPADSVHLHLWRQDLGGRLDGEPPPTLPYVFSGGYTNRDYGLLLRAAAELPARFQIVASRLNGEDWPEAGNVDVLFDVEAIEFERRLAASRLVVLPLKAGGEACGQSVLLRVLRNGKPLIITRHESVVPYLGRDFPGFVEAGNAVALKQAIARALEDADFESQLRQAVHRAATALNQLRPAGEDIRECLAR